MNSNNHLYQIQLTEWATRFADQKNSGLTVKQWCQANNISIHKYNYWKHLLKQEAISQVLPDIIPISFSPEAVNVSPLTSSDVTYSNSANRPIREAAIIERKFRMDIFVPNTLFLFCGGSAKKIKGLLWEGDGFLLLYKRVESGRFTWPRNSEELRSLSPEQFKYLMQGFAVDPIIHDVTPKHSA